MPEEILARLRAPAPREPQGAESAYREFLETVPPYALGNNHPRFWAWYMGNGTPFGAVADFLAAEKASTVFAVSDTTTTGESGETIGLIRCVAYEA
jgi:hypothetical protein